MPFVNARSVPAGVREAVTLLWWSLALAIVKGILDTVLISQDGAIDAGMAGLLINTVVIAFLIRQIAHGAAWARALLLALFVISLVPFAVLTALEFERSLPLGVLSVILLALQIVALSLLFRAPQSAWFQRGR